MSRLTVGPPADARAQEYEKAKDCFTTALAVRPEVRPARTMATRVLTLRAQDWQLYNRVGATLANSGRPGEALDYYYRALELNPAYLRARCVPARLAHLLHPIQ